MSSKQSKNKQAQYQSSNRPFIKILAFILVLLMLLGAAYTVIVVILSTKANAASNDDYEDLTVRVGIMYGTGVTSSYWVSTVGGFDIYSQKLDNNDKSSVKLFSISDSALIVTNDENLVYSEVYGTYVKATNTKNVDVGSYHIEINHNFDTYSNLYSYLNSKKNGLKEICDCSCFMSYINGSFKMRIGSFATKDEAVRAMSVVSSYISEYDLKLVSPSSTAISILSASSRTIIFEYDCDDVSYCGIKPTIQTSYIKAPTGNLYSGIFTFKRYITTNADGVSVINVLPLEDYVAGVLPYECSGYWPLETLKAFAIAVRSYTISVMGRHNASYSCDTCTSSHCQVYSGINLITDTVKQAIKETRGQVMTCNGELCCAYYSSSVGGITVNVEDAWGGAPSDYLKAIRTPWEDYVNHSNGYWIVEISPIELLNYLKNTKGYKSLTGTKIADINILDYATDSTYVKTIEFVDDLGNSIIITNTDKVRTILSSYCKSANFVVGKGSVDYFIDVVRTKPIDDISYDIDVPDEETHPFSSSLTNMIKYTVRTGENISTTASRNDEDYIYVATDKGTSRTSSQGYYVLTADNYKYFGIDVPELKEVDENDNKYSILQYSTANASSSDNFIFVGKGWGHGVGMSQYGAYDLAHMGYNYLEIIDLYFDNIVIMDFRKIK